MKQLRLLTVVAAFGVLSVMTFIFDRQAQAQGHSSNDAVQPTVFQAAGPSVESIQGLVDEFRTALGEPNNANAPGPLPSGRREINWDGGGSTATAVVGTPFDGFLGTRGARFITLGTGFVQAPVDGLAETFDNQSYKDIFQPFSPVRLFTPIGSNLTEARFFVPGGTPGSEIPATVSGFGAVFTDVDRPGGKSLLRGRLRVGSALIKYYGADGQLLFSSMVPASPGDAGLSFFGVMFDSPLIARVLIVSGDAAPGPDDEKVPDIVVMDDFIYGEPQASNGELQAGNEQTQADDEDPDAVQ